MAYNKEYAKEYYIKNKSRLKTPEKMEASRVAVSKWRKNNREAAILSAAKARAKRLNYDFNLELSDILIPNVCPILFIPLFFSEGYQHDGTPALDRVDNSKGYIKGNVQVISHKANRHKADLSVDEIERLFNYTRVLK